jgi:hypothetical protein
MNQTFTPSLKQICGGLSLMIIFTACWVAIAEYQLNGKDYGIIGILFFLIIAVFISYFIKFVKRARKPPATAEVVKTAAENKHKKGFIIINTLQGLAIFLSSVILTNLHLSDYFIPSLAMIVGLHFFALGYLFNRPFDYAAGSWTCIFAMTGILLTYQESPHNQVAALVAFGAACAPAAYALRMIQNGNTLIAKMP